MSWNQIRNVIKKEEDRIEESLGISLQAYGSGSQGYELLADCINDNSYWMEDGKKPAEEIWYENSRRSRILEKQVHEYWTFMMLVEALVSGKVYEGDETFFYQPTQGNRRQRPIIGMPRGYLFVEPCLTGYDDQAIRHRYKERLNFLTELKSRNVRPDMMLTDLDTKKIPWGAWIWVSAGLVDREPAQERDWERFSDGVKYIIECKDRKPRRKDLSQTLWYALAYRKPLLFIIQGQLDARTRRGFQKDINELETKVRVIEGFKIGKRDSCQEKLRFLKTV